MCVCVVPISVSLSATSSSGLGLDAILPLAGSLRTIHVRISFLIRGKIWRRFASPAGVAARNALLRQLEAAHKANMEEIRAEKDVEVSGLKKMVADMLERVGVGGGPRSKHEAKKARLKDLDESDTRHACD